MKKIIILEGLDNVGKTTIKELLNKKTNYNYCIIDRFLGSCFAYSLLKDRDNPWEFLDLEKTLDNKIFYLVYLYSNQRDILSRQKLKKDNDININMIDELSIFYNYYLNNTHLKALILNTSKFS